MMLKESEVLRRVALTANIMFVAAGSTMLGQYGTTLYGLRRDGFQA
jgi:hypothetical protein